MTSDISPRRDIWANPEPIAEGLPAVPAFPERLMPEALRPWVQDASDRMQCPPDFLAVAAIVSMGAVVGRACGIKPRRFDDWTLVANLWGAVVARSGQMKTPAIEQALAPIKRLEAQAQEKNRQSIKDYEFQARVLKARQADAEKKLAKATGDELIALREVLEQEVQPPGARRLMTVDATIEKMGVILRDNPRGILQYRDELTGFLASMSREGHESDRAFYLESWSGMGSYTFDRIGRGTIYLPALCISVLGGIQPEPLAVQLRATLKGGTAADGWLQRFQVLAWPDSTTWRNVDRWPDTAAREQAFDLYERLANQSFPMDGPNDPIPTLRFDAAAQENFDAWLTEHENRIRSGTEHPAFESHLSKYKKLVPALALLGHVADVGAGPVRVESVARALAWADYLEAHARRVYASVTQADEIGALTLLQKIRRGEVKAPLIARDIYRHCWAGLASKEEVDGALTVLETHGYVRQVEVPGSQTGGRSRVEFEVHPSLVKKESA